MFVTSLVIFHSSKHHQHLTGVQTTVDSKRTQLLKSKSYFENALQIHYAIYGVAHQETQHVYLRWDDVVKELKKLDE
jgi:hypothetical protein